VTTTPAQSQSTLEVYASHAKQALEDGRRARADHDLDAFQRALHRFMDAAADWQCAHDDVSRRADHSLDR
jgi:hypothetical protein